MSDDEPVTVKDLSELGGPLNLLAHVAEKSYDRFNGGDGAGRSRPGRGRLQSPVVHRAVEVAGEALLGKEDLNQQGPNMAVLVRQPDHERHGQVGRQTAYDWRESGKVFIDFPDDESEAIHDSQFGEGKTQSFYALDDEVGRLYDLDGRGPRHLQLRFFHMGGERETLKRDYETLFDAELPEFR